MSDKCFCFKIVNLEQYIKLSHSKRIDYEIELKKRLNQRFANSVFPTCFEGLVYVKLWSQQKKEDLFKPINYSFATLEPVDLSDEDLALQEYVLSKKELKVIDDSVYHNLKDFIIKRADIINFAYENDIYTVYGPKFNIETLKRQLNNESDAFRENEVAKMSYSKALTLDSANNNTTGATNYITDFEKNEIARPGTYEYKNVKIMIYTKSIVDLEVEAVTNSLNTSISFNGFGLANLFLRKYGSKIEEKSKKVAKSLGQITERMCFEVETGRSNPKYILNVISPNYNSMQSEFKNALFVSFMNLFELSKSLKLKQIALPLLCTGVYGAPKPICSEILAAAITSHIDITNDLTLKEIHLVNIDQETTACLIEHTELILLRKMSLQEKTLIQNESKIEKVNEAENESDRRTESRIKHVKNSSVIVNCQVCRQRTRNWIELTNCNHKICTICLLDLKKNNDKCIVSECVEKLKKVYKEEEFYSKSCGICHEENLTNQEFIKFEICNHKVCKKCCKKLFKRDAKCPFCQKRFSNQPKNCEMVENLNKHSSLSGYENYDTIEITYHVPKGFQESDQPNPGKIYESVIKKAYLPNNTQGQEVLSLLKEALELGLTFTISDSNEITWNGIYHKTSKQGRDGFPDSTYLDRVIKELKAKGVE